MAHPNEELLRRFYEAFGRSDAATMAACYAPDARFSDPVFPDLRGPDPGRMWQMLTEGGGDLEIELVDHEAGDQTGTAHWIARYTFTQTGRPVVNDIRATFKFKHGLIAEHRDDFDFHRWARQALGPVGLLLGWTPILRGKVRGQAAKRLAEFTTPAERTSGP